MALLWLGLIERFILILSIDWGASVLNEFFFVKKRYYTTFCHLLFFPNTSCPQLLFCEPRANHQFPTITNLQLSRVSSFFPFPLTLSIYRYSWESPYQVARSIPWKHFYYYYKSFSIISSSALGPASPGNQYHSFAQLPCRRETSFPTLDPFYHRLFHEPMGMVHLS